MRRRKYYPKNLTWAQQLAYAYLNKGYSSAGLRNRILSDKYTEQEILDWFSNIVGFKVTRGIFKQVRQELGAMFTPEQVTELNLNRQKDLEKRRVAAFKKCGYSLKQLLYRYENDVYFTDKDVLNIVNKNVDKENEPELIFNKTWLKQHFFPYIHQKDMGSVSRTELRFRKRLFAELGKREHEFSNRTIVAPREIDIYFPKDKIAIEFNGDRWHSEEALMQSRNEHAYDYHKKKFDQCAEQGITLLFVWERDWVKNPDRIINAIKAVFDGKPVYKVLKKFKGAK